MLDAFSALLVQFEEPSHVGFVSLRLDGSRVGQMNLLLWSKLNIHFTCNRPRNLALQSQNIPQIAIIVGSPQVLVGWCLNQLRCDSHLAARAFDRSLNYRVHMEFARYFGQRLFGSLVMHRGSP